jgi:hypothetical protein
VSGIPKHGRRDNNDGELAGTARQLGWYLYQTQEPGDYLGCLRARIDRGWFVIEAKAAKGKLTERQILFRADCKTWGMPYLVWRCAEDVVLQTNALRLGR